MDTELNPLSSTLVELSRFQCSERCFMSVYSKTIVKSDKTDRIESNRIESDKTDRIFFVVVLFI